MKFGMIGFTDDKGYSWKVVPVGSLAPEAGRAEAVVAALRGAVESLPKINKACRDLKKILLIDGPYQGGNPVSQLTDTILLESDFNSFHLRGLKETN